MRRFHLLPLILLAAVAVTSFSGCQSLPTAQSELSPQARFADYQTFAVLPPRARDGQVEPRDLVRLAGPMRSHLESQLQTRGLQPAKPENADIVFELIGSVSAEIALYPAPERAAYRWGWSTRYPLYGYYTPRTTLVETRERGVLSIVAYDRQSRSVVWAAWMEGTYHPGEKPETVKAALDALLATMPAK